MTKRDIYESEKKNPGVIYLYPEGMFYRAYEMSAFYLCKLVHPFKVSGHYVKSVGAFIVSVGFPQATLEKWSTGHPVADFRNLSKFGATNEFDHEKDYLHPISHSFLRYFLFKGTI